MAVGPRLELRQSQSLVMTPQLQQAIRLLALPNLELEGFIAEAFAANPLIEVGEPQDADVAAASGDEGRTSGETLSAAKLVADAGQRMPGDAALLSPEPGGGAPRHTGDISNGAQPRASAGADDVRQLADDERASAPPTLAQHLHRQAGAVRAPAERLTLAHWLIGQLDEAGYLTVTVEEAAAALALPKADVEAALELVQSLEPTGVGARNLADCLALQAREVDRCDPAMTKLLDHLDLLANGSLAQLKKVCGIDDEDLAEMLAELRGYDPKPGLRYGAAVVAAVVPDVLVHEAADGGWELALNPATLPRVLVDRNYYLELRGQCRERAERSWLAGKLGEASWLVKALDQRQRTILAVAAEIVRNQAGFLRGGVAHLKPLTLRAVADAIGMHESTVSRVTSNKYLQCSRGTFELKHFFASGVATASGEGLASAGAVKAALRDLIEQERADAVLSDDLLVELLRQRGFELARRTVAKYREAIGIGSSVHRRRQKALAGLR